MSKQKIDLSKLVAGDQVKTKNGKILTFQEYSNDNGCFPYIFFYKLEHYSYVKDGHYYLGTTVSPMDIVEILTTPKKEFDFSSLPKNCTEIVLDGIRYEKKEKVTTTVTWEKKL